MEEGHATNVGVPVLPFQPSGVGFRNAMVTLSATFDQSISECAVDAANIEVFPRVDFLYMLSLS